MLTRTMSVTLGAALVTLLSTATAQAQDRWVPYVSGFGGGSFIPSLTVNIVDAATASTFDVSDRKIVNAAAWGASFGVWRKLDGRTRWGIRGDVLHQRTNANQQLLRATGTLGGRPYDGPLPVPSADGSTTFLAGMFMLGWQLGGDAEHLPGRVTPYVGIGGGLDHTSATFRFPQPLESSDVGGAVQAAAGVSVGVSGRVALFTEYRWSRVSQNLLVGTQQSGFVANPHQVVGGFTVGF
jgi:opacity protein-like surface antigen